MAETLENFVNQVSDGIAPKSSGRPWYNSSGDCIHFHWRDDEFYRDWLDDKITIYRSVSTDEAVGCQIKGVLALVQKLGEFGISVSEKTGVPLAMFLFASHLAGEPLEEKIIAREKIYRYIMGMVGKETVKLQPAREEAGSRV